MRAFRRRVDHKRQRHLLELPHFQFAQTSRSTAFSVFIDRGSLIRTLQHPWRPFHKFQWLVESRFPGLARHLRRIKSLVVRACSTDSDRQLDSASHRLRQGSNKKFPHARYYWLLQSVYSRLGGLPLRPARVSPTFRLIGRGIAACGA